LDLEKSKLLLVIVLALLVLPIISAPPPFVGETTTLDIRVPRNEIFKQNQDYTLHIHVWNASEQLFNDTTSCNAHAYNISGSHIMEEHDLDFDGNLQEWKATVNSNNFSTLGFISLIAYCNTSTQSGFLDLTAEVTGTGIEFTDARATAYLTLILVLIFTIIMTLTGIHFLPKANTPNPEGKIISISYLKYLRGVLWLLSYSLLMALFFVSSNIAYAYLGASLFADLLFALFTITLSLSPVIVVVWFISFLAMFFQDKSIQKLFKRGFFPGSV